MVSFALSGQKKLHNDSNTCEDIVKLVSPKSVFKRIYSVISNSIYGA